MAEHTSSLADAGFRFEDASVLDFGCGCGRILRYFARYAAKCKFTGADVDADAIDWCRNTLTFADFVHRPKLPPTALPAAAYDAAFSFSVFTHLPESAHVRWLAELARVLKPGGLLVLTIHGAHAVQRWLAGNTPSPYPTQQMLAKSLPALEKKGYLFYAFTRMDSPHAVNEKYWGAYDLSLYGNTFITRGYIEKNWLRDFELVALHAAPDGWQDYVVLRRRGQDGDAGHRRRELGVERSPARPDAARRESAGSSFPTCVSAAVAVGR